MRISDWSSDVCSSDLVLVRSRIETRDAMGVLLSGCGVAWRGSGAARMFRDLWIRSCESGRMNQGGSMRANLNRHPRHDERSLTISTPRPRRSAPCRRPRAPPADRSEEHTYELQPLMRLS